MEKLTFSEFPDLEDGFYTMRQQGGYLVKKGEQVTHFSFEERDLAWLMREYRDDPQIRFTGLLPEKYQVYFRKETRRLKRIELGITEERRQEIERLLDQE